MLQTLLQLAHRLKVHQESKVLELGCPKNHLGECSFCHKSQEQVNILIAGPGVFICDVCVDICNKIISREIPPLAQEEVDKLLDSGLDSD